MWPAVAHSFFFAACWITLISRTLNEGDNLHAVLAFLHGASQGFPGMEREHVLARPDIGFRDTLCHEAFKDRSVVHHALAGASICQCFDLHFSLCHYDCS